jgi:hypothetical protein
VRKVAMDWKPVREMLSENYRWIMLAAMAIELILLSWIAWKA